MAGERWRERRQEAEGERDELRLPRVSGGKMRASLREKRNERGHFTRGSGLGERQGGGGGGGG